MTGIYGNSQEDKYRERELDRYLDEKQALDDADEKEEAEEEDEKELASNKNYNFPEWLHNNLNFSLLVKSLSHVELSRFVYYIAIIADEKVERDERHWAGDELNVFLNKMVKDRSAK